jgi:hypothetical protein
MTDAVLPPPAAREARRSLQRRRNRAIARAIVIWIPLIVAGAAINEVGDVSQAVSTAVGFGLLGATVAAALLYGRSRRSRARAAAWRDAYLADLRAAARALTPAERAREMDTVGEGGYDDAVVQEIRALLASQPGGMRPLPPLAVKDPDDWFRPGGLLKLRALAASPAAGLALGAVAVLISNVGFEPIGLLGLFGLILPGLLTWWDYDLADAQPGERAAWSLGATFLTLACFMAIALAIGL